MREPGQNQLPQGSHRIPTAGRTSPSARARLTKGSEPFEPLNLITHPTTRRGSDFYTRLGMQWEQMCQAVLRIELGAVELTPGVTLELTLADPTKDKTPEPLGSGASFDAGPRGFESRYAPVFTGPYDAGDQAGNGCRQPSDASDAAPLASAVPAYLEACARMAADAAGKGELERARVLITRAALVSALEAERRAVQGRVE